MKHDNPLLLLDNSSMMTVIGEGEFTSHRMTRMTSASALPTVIL